jgi:hypothetical protein
MRERCRRIVEAQALEPPPGRDEIVEESKRTQDALAVLQRKLEALPAAPDKR